MIIDHSKHKILRPALPLFFVLTAFFKVSGKAQTGQPSLDVPLTDGSKLTIEGPHRFVDIHGIKVCW
jgi:hypothetical protein